VTLEGNPDPKPKDWNMESITRSVSPLVAAVRDELREARAARTTRRSLERELESYRSAADLNDLEAILDRHSEEETADIRRILAGRRSA
jgi:predicted secreted Zn-dependent protease